jgi:hypothetical protein
MVKIFTGTSPLILSVDNVAGKKNIENALLHTVGHHVVGLSEMRVPHARERNIHQLARKHSYNAYVSLPADKSLCMVCQHE